MIGETASAVSGLPESEQPAEMKEFSSGYYCHLKIDSEKRIWELDGVELKKPTGITLKPCDELGATCTAIIELPVTLYRRDDITAVAT